MKEPLYSGIMTQRKKVLVLLALICCSWARGEQEDDSDECKVSQEVLVHLTTQLSNALTASKRSDSRCSSQMQTGELLVQVKSSVDKVLEKVAKQPALHHKRTADWLPRAGGTFFSRRTKAYFFSYSPVFPLNNLQLSWDEAESWCKDHGMRFVSFDTADEWHDISKHLRTILNEENFWVSVKWESGPGLHRTPYHGKVEGDVFRWDSGQQLAEAVVMSENGGGRCVNARLGLSDEFYANNCDRQFYFMCQF